MSAKKKKKFNIYNLFMGGEGKGVKKNPEGYGKRDFLTYFKFVWRNLSRLVTINAYIVFGNFPLLIGLFALSGYTNRSISSPASQLFAPLHGIMLHGNKNPVTMALFGVHGIQGNHQIISPLTLTLFGLSALVIFTFGYVNVGTTYIMRNIVKGEPIFMWSDFWYAIKRNLKGGMLMGIFDILCLGLLGYDIMVFYLNLGPFLNNVMFYICLAIAVIYLNMRFYMYIMLITFDLSFPKILKNSLIFAFLNFKRNFAAVVGILLYLFVNYSLLLMYIPLGMIMPFVITFGICSFTACYAAFPKIKEIMIDPYADEEKEKEDLPEPIFHDEG